MLARNALILPAPFGSMVMTMLGSLSIAINSSTGMRSLVAREPQLDKQEVVGVQVRQSHVVQRDRVGAIQCYHRVGTNLLGVGHDGTEVCEQRCVKLNDVADAGARGEVSDAVDTESIVEHECVVASRARERVIPGGSFDDVCTAIRAQYVAKRTSG